MGNSGFSGVAINEMKYKVRVKIPGKSLTTKRQQIWWAECIKHLKKRHEVKALSKTQAEKVRKWYEKQYKHYEFICDLVEEPLKKVVKKTVVKRKKNPVPPSKAAKLREACDLYERFTGHIPEFYDEIKINWPDVGLKVGMCDGILYETVRDGKVEHYIHRFKKSARPVLAAAHDGRGIALIGGNYRFTDRGIVDNK